MSLWQTKSWQEMLAKSHQTEKYFEVDGLFVEKRKVALGEYGLFVLGVEKIEEKALEKLKELCKKEKALFVQIETLDYNGDVSEIHLYNSSISPLLSTGEGLGVRGLTGKDLEVRVLTEEGWKMRAYKKFITPYTALIDLNQTKEEILAKMKPKGRYNIRLAEKKGIKVKEVEKTKENVEIFYNLMRETTTRDDFHGNTLDYYFTFLNELENSKLLFAEFEGKVIASGIFVYTKDVVIYYYGASTSDEKYRNLMSPYLLQWTAILLGKENKSKLYDFLGVANPGDKKSSLTGVTDFKMKFTQDIRKVSEASIWINRKWKYCLIKFLKKLKK